jgi:hypothetical protein
MEEVELRSRLLILKLTMTCSEGTRRVLLIIVDL